MKIWKQLVCVLLALMLLAALAACDPAQNETTAPTKTTTEPAKDTVPQDTTAPVEDTVPPTTEDMSVYAAFIGTWYEGGSDVANRLIIDGEKNWRYEDEAGELLMTGYYELQDEKVLNLYNNDVEMVTGVRLDGENGIYLEPCIDIAFELIQNNDFSKVVTNSESMDNDDIIDDIGGEEPGVEDEVAE